MEDEIITYSKSRILKLETLFFTVWKSKTSFQEFSGPNAEILVEFCEKLLQDFKEEME